MSWSEVNIVLIFFLFLGFLVHFDICALETSISQSSHVPIYVLLRLCSQTLYDVVICQLQSVEFW